MAFRRAHPAAGGDHHGYRLVGDQRGLVDGLRRFALDDLRTPLVAKFLRVGLDLRGHQLFQFRFALEQRFELRLFRLELLLLFADLHFLELGEMAQLGLENRLDLLLGQLEALHQHGLRLILTANDTDHLIEVEENDQQAREDVQTLLDLRRAGAASGASPC